MQVLYASLGAELKVGKNQNAVTKGGEKPGEASLEAKCEIPHDPYFPLKYQFCNAPEDTPFERLAEMSHSRYWMERAIQDAKGEAAMDEYQVRGWRGWHHHMTMTILAMLFLLELQLDWQPKAPMLTLRDVREILEVILPQRTITSKQILQLIEQKHKARRSARLSHQRRQNKRNQRTQAKT